MVTGVPYCRYLPGISPAQPGLKIAFQRENLLSQFPDAFEPYLHFGVTLREPLQGTLFRFPLRCGFRAFPLPSHLAVVQHSNSVFRYSAVLAVHSPCVHAP